MYIEGVVVVGVRYFQGSKRVGACMHVVMVLAGGGDNMWSYFLSVRIVRLK